MEEIITKGFQRFGDYYGRKISTAFGRDCIKSRLQRFSELLLIIVIGGRGSPPIESSNIFLFLTRSKICGI
jgi:hypothetical protein